MTAAEILSVAALVDGHDALAFPSFRAGPTGPRVVALCRIGGQPLRPREQIGQPNGLIVQDPEAPQLSDLCDGLNPTVTCSSTRPGASRSSASTRWPPTCAPTAG